MEDAKKDLLKTVGASESRKKPRATQSAIDPNFRLLDEGYEAWQDWMFGTEDDPTAWRLGGEWLTGTGPADRELKDQHRFTRRFQKSATVGRMRDYLYEKYDGHPKDGDFVDNYAAEFNWEYLDPRSTSEEHLLGSWAGEAHVRDGRIHFKIKNKSGTHSFFQGNPLSELRERTGLPIPTVPDYERSEFGPGGTTSQTITWSEPVIPRKLGRDESWWEW